MVFKKKLEKRVGEWESELIDIGSEEKEHLVACHLPKSWVIIGNNNNSLLFLATPVSANRNSNEIVVGIDAAEVSYEQ